MFLLQFQQFGAFHCSLKTTNWLRHKIFPSTLFSAKGKGVFFQNDSDERVCSDSALKSDSLSFCPEKFNMIIIFSQLYKFYTSDNLQYQRLKLVQSAEKTLNNKTKTFYS